MVRRMSTARHDAPLAQGQGRVWALFVDGARLQGKRTLSALTSFLPLLESQPPFTQENPCHFSLLHVVGLVSRHVHTSATLLLLLQGSIIGWRGVRDVVVAHTVWLHFLFQTLPRRGQRKTGTLKVQSSMELRNQCSIGSGRSSQSVDLPYTVWPVHARISRRMCVF